MDLADSADSTDLADLADLTDTADLTDLADSADSTDSADLANLADWYFNQHLKSPGLFLERGLLLLLLSVAFNRELTVKMSI